MRRWAPRLLMLTPYMFPRLSWHDTGPAALLAYVETIDRVAGRDSVAAAGRPI